MTARIGLEARIYFSTTSVGAIPTWTEIKTARDVTLALEHGEAEVKHRGSPWTKVLLGHKNASVEFEITYDKTDAGYQALRDAWINKTDLALAIMDELITTSGAEGLQADFKVVRFTRNEPLEESLTVSVAVRPSAESTAEPAWVEVP